MKELVIARVRNSIVASPPWCKTAQLPESELVMAVSADNPPENNAIRWWVKPLPGTPEKPWHVYADDGAGYGVGAGEDDLEVVLDIGNELHKLGVGVYS